MKQDNTANVILSALSFFCAIISVIIMYYILAGVSLALAIATINNERTRKLSLSSISIVCFTFVLKVIYTLIVNGNLPEWLIKGLF